MTDAQIENNLNIVHTIDIKNNRHEYRFRPLKDDALVCQFRDWLNTLTDVEYSMDWPWHFLRFKNESDRLVLHERFGSAIYLVEHETILESVLVPDISEEMKLLEDELAKIFQEEIDKEIDKEIVRRLAESKGEIMTNPILEKLKAEVVRLRQHNPMYERGEIGAQLKDLTFKRADQLEEAATEIERLMGLLDAAGLKY